MATINSCPSIKWFKWSRKRPYISCCPLWDEHRTPLLPHNAIDPSFNLPSESDATDAPSPPPSLLSPPPIPNLILKLSEGSNFPSPQA